MIILNSNPAGLRYSTEIVAASIDFVGSGEEDVIIPIGKSIREVIRGRLYVYEDPGASFDSWATYNFYSRARMRGEDAFYRTSTKLVYTGLEEETTGADAYITPDDHTHFSPHDLAFFLDGPASEFVRLKTIADTMVAEDMVASHPAGTGLARVSEFSGFSLFNGESGTDIYLRITLENPVTINLKMELTLRK